MVTLGKFKGLYSFRKAFSDEKACILHLLEVFNEKAPKCPHCSHTDFNYISTRRKFQCKKCRRQFSPLKDTTFEQTNIPLSKWYLAMYFFVSFPKGVCSLQLSKELEITQKAAWHIMQKVKDRVKSVDPSLLGGGGEVEMDEAYSGGKGNANTKLGKDKIAKKGKEGSKGIQGKSMEAKVPLVVIRDRSTKKLKAMTSPSTQNHALLSIMKDNIILGSTVYTDDNPSYLLSDNYYDRKYTNHSDGEYAKGRCHSNSVESFWSLFMRGFVGTYHSMSYKHLDKYLAEFAFRSENRHLTVEEKFNLVLSKMVGVIKYTDITKFDMYKHNYSGRGPTYPLELLKATRKRGKISPKREEELKSKGSYYYYTKYLNKETFEELYSDYDPTIAEGIVTKHTIPSDTFSEPPIIPTVHEGGTKRGRNKGTKNFKKETLELKSKNEKINIEIDSKNISKIKNVASRHFSVEELQKILADKLQSDKEV